MTYSNAVSINSSKALVKVNPYTNTRPIVSLTSPTRRLTPKEIKEHKANDLYFTCYKPGYRSRDPYNVKGNYTGPALLKTIDVDEDYQDASK